MTTPGTVRIYQPPTTEPNATIKVDVLADGSIRQVIRTEGPPLEVEHGSVTGVVPGVTDTVVSYVVPSLYFGLTGCSVIGTGDGQVHLLVDGSPVGGTVISALSKSPSVRLPAPYPVAQGSTVAVTVLCTATGAANFEVFLYGEVLPDSG